MRVCSRTLDIQTQSILHACNERWGQTWADDEQDGIVDRQFLVKKGSFILADYRSVVIHPLTLASGQHQLLNPLSRSMFSPLLLSAFKLPTCLNCLKHRSQHRPPRHHQPLAACSGSWHAHLRQEMVARHGKIYVQRDCGQVRTKSENGN